MSARLAKRLLAEPDYWTSPAGIRVRPEPALTYGPEVADLCARAGSEPDPQQELGLDLIFAIRPDGSPASFATGVVACRQNIKTELFLQCVIGWLFVLDDVAETSFSAHELKTALKAQDRLFSLLESPALSRYLPGDKNHGKYDTNGKERQELRTGQTVGFYSRTRDGGRGLGVPKVVLDEFFKMKARALGAMLPIMLAQHHPQYVAGSSAPPADPDAEALRDMQDRGRNHKSSDLTYLEWGSRREPCADPDCVHPKDAAARGLDCALDRLPLLEHANAPGLTSGRITIRTLQALRQEMPPAEYMRECLGWEDDADQARPRAVDPGRWSDERVRRPDAGPPTRACVVLDTEPGRAVTSIGVAGRNAAGNLIVLEHTAPGQDWVLGRLERVRDQLGKGLLEVALHPHGEAKTLVPALTAAGFEHRRLTHHDLAGGCSTLITKVSKAALVHVGQEQLDAAVEAASTRVLGEEEMWRRDSAVPMAPLVACATALYRFELAEADRPKDPPPSPVTLDDLGQGGGPAYAGEPVSIHTIGF